MIVGLGVYQGLEFLLERGLWEILGKGAVVASRLYNSLRLLARVPACRFVSGRTTGKKLPVPHRLYPPTMGLESPLLPTTSDTVRNICGA